MERIHMVKANPAVLASTLRGAVVSPRYDPWLRVLVPPVHNLTVFYEEYYEILKVCNLSFSK